MTMAWCGDHMSQRSVTLAPEHGLQHGSALACSWQTHGCTATGPFSGGDEASILMWAGKSVRRREGQRALACSAPQRLASQWMAGSPAPRRLGRGSVTQRRRGLRYQEKAGSVPCPYCREASSDTHPTSQISPLTNHGGVPCAPAPVGPEGLGPPLAQCGSPWPFILGPGCSRARSEWLFLLIPICSVGSLKRVPSTSKSKHCQSSFIALLG